MTDSSIDPTVAHPARIYDYWLGGKDNYLADRAAAEEVLKSVPVLAEGARANRAFLGRAVRYLVSEAGIRQFLDIGSGLPTAANTHEVAEDAAQGTRVVYVDNDMTVATHARALLVDADSAAFIESDLRDVPRILAEAGTPLDLGQPVAVMLLLVLHLIPDSDDPRALVASLMDPLAPGSALVISHPASDILPEQVAQGRRDFNRMSAVPMTGRSREQVEQFFAGMTLAEPGLVEPQHWRLPHALDSRLAIPAWCGVAIKP
jgi:hypothetical protein